jgi:SH3 domain-containing YSC84-like protein 1
VKMTSMLLVSALALANGNLWAGTGLQDSIDRLRISSEVIHASLDAPDKGIPSEVLSSAKCIVVIPHLVKGGFIFGAEHGRGVASCRTSEGWSAPAFVSVGGGNWGLQIGVEGVDVIMLVMNDQGFQHMLTSKFELSGDASAAAGPVGRHASAGTDWKMNTEVLTYSRARGLFAGITLNGAVLEPDDDSTRAIYGREVPFRSILSGDIQAPKSTLDFMKAIGDAGHAGAVAEVGAEQK